MSTELVINATPQETRVALVENGNVAELYIERKHEKSIIGNIYKGRVVKVLPGMQAGFVDIGMEKAAFLYVSDIYNGLQEFERMMMEGYEDEMLEIEGDQKGADLSASYSIEDLLCEGQEIIVQVSKEPIGTKGARITSHISLPGRYLVFMPTMNHVGVSRRIENEKERRRLRELIKEIRPVQAGFIARTVSEGASKEKLADEMNFLIKLWENIQIKKECAPVHSLIYEDLDITLRSVRDLFTHDVDRLVVDSPDEYQRILDFLDKFSPSLKHSVELYEDREPIFDTYGIELEISRALGRKVWLKSGGYIIIETTEALTAIDVNTGKYVGKRNLEETILKTNLEAVKEIAYQLRLRNIGGIIIIDFIDMDKESNKEKVFNALREALKKDRSKTNILKISELGLVQMSRKRAREDILRTLCEPCAYCEGKGFVKSKETICYEIFREIKREAPFWGDPAEVTVNVNPEIAEILWDEQRAGVEDLEERHGVKITVNAKAHFHQEQYEVIPKFSGY